MAEAHRWTHPRGFAVGNWRDGDPFAPKRRDDTERKLKEGYKLTRAHTYGSLFDPAGVGGAVDNLMADKQRLDFLDDINKTLNRRYGTRYGWRLILSPHVVRLLSEHGGHSGYLGAVDLNDSDARGDVSCRVAIDNAIARR